MRIATIVVLGGWVMPLQAGAAVTAGSCYADHIVAAGAPLDFVSSLSIRSSDGKLFAADDDGQAEIYRLDDDGPRKVADVTTPGFTSAGGTSLSAIVFAPDGVLHAALADGRVYRFPVLADDAAASAAELVLTFPAGWLTDIAFDGPTTLYAADFSTGSGDPLYRATVSGTGWQIETVATADGISGLHVGADGTVHLTEWATGTIFRLGATGLTALGSAGVPFNFQLALDGKFAPHPSDGAAWLITVGRDTSVREARANETSVLASGYADSTTWPGTDTFPSDIVRGSGTETYIADGTGVHRLDFTCATGGPGSTGALVDPFLSSPASEAPAAGCAIAGNAGQGRETSPWTAVAATSFLLASIVRRRVRGS